MTEIEPWDIFVLASSARLGPFPGVHLAPKLSAQSLGVAIRANLPLAPNEFLAAVVENESGGFPCPVILSNRRMYWFLRTDVNSGSDGPTPTIHCEVLDYAHLGTEIQVRPMTGTGEGAELDLGGGRVIPLPRATPAMAGALAETLRQLGEAARSGETPSVESVDPEMAQRIAKVVPQAIEVTHRLRLHGGDLAKFRDDLMAATPSTFVTSALIASCVGVYALMVFGGVSPMTPTADALLAWGGNDGLRVVLQHEYWRLPASVFLHGGLLHLAVNMWCLRSLGPLVERFYGNLGYACLYLAAGIGGAVASAATPPARVSVGASGAIFGILGALLAFLLLRRRAVPASVLAPLRSSALSFVVFNTLFGAIVPAIDQAAHMGGLATGFVVGLILAPKWPRRESARGIARTALLSLLAALILTGLSATVLNWRAGNITAVDMVRDFGRQFQPPYERFVELAKANVQVAKLLDQGDDPTARAELASLLDVAAERGRENLDDIAQIQTTEPRLQEVARLLQAAQTELNAGLEAVKQYLKTDDRALIEGPEGFVAHASAAAKHDQECQRLQYEYLLENGLIREDAEEVD